MFLRQPSLLPSCVVVSRLLPFPPSVSASFSSAAATVADGGRTTHVNRKGRQSRGVLGFQIHDHQESFYAPKGGSSGFSLHSTKALSGIDARTWNVPESLVLEDDSEEEDGTTLMKTKPNSNKEKLPLLFRSLQATLPSSTTTVTTGTALDDGSSSSSSRDSGGDVAWVPSDSEIEELTVVRLKSELNDRDLKRTGNKAELVQRLKIWCLERRLASEDGGGGGGMHRSVRSTTGSLSSLGLQQAYGTRSGVPTTTPQQPAKSTSSPDRLRANSLAEWAQTVDLEPLLQRRENIRREKLQGKAPEKRRSYSKPVTMPSDYRHLLSKVFDKPSARYSNRDVKQMYAASKHADQAGDRELSKRILEELKIATPNDARVFRRLARMENEEGNVVAAKAILKEGLKLHPDNAYLWHGLAQLETGSTQREMYGRAIAADPSLPHPHHALGTLEHTMGRVANAMKILKRGLEYCPTNHRLHHALGDVYRDAKMLNLAERSYEKAVQHGPHVSHGFAYTALAYVAYEQGQVDRARRWLQRAVNVNRGRQANAWVSLALLEESEGGIDAARSVCIKGIAQYERSLLGRFKFQPEDLPSYEFLDPVSLKNELLHTVPSYRSGDRFFNLYRNWIRLEERYGTVDSLEEVYKRAAIAFPYNWKLAVDVAEYYVKLSMIGKAREHYSQACTKAGNFHADPYRMYAEFEMARGNWAEARGILYSGALALTQNVENEACGRGLAELFLTWAVCEWNLREYYHTEQLFGQALEVATEEEDSSSLRSFILYAMARFEVERDEQQRAQHFVGLCIKENNMPRGYSKVWDLWATVAHEMGNEKLTLQCRDQAAKARQEEQEDDKDLSGLSRLLRRPSTSSQGTGDVSDVQQLMRRDPWHTQIFGPGKQSSLTSIYFLLPKSRVTSEHPEDIVESA
jgi:tetratricopeptide (TPR) repeat protein